MNWYDMDSSSEEEDEWDEDEELVILMTMEMESNKKPKHGGSVVGRENIRRRRQEGHQRLMLDYFGVPGSRRVFPEHYFRRRFRMGTDLFIYISNVIKEKDTFFEQKRNCTGLLGHSTLQKMTAALRIMAYGIPADLVDDNIAMAEHGHLMFEAICKGVGQLSPSAQTMASGFLAVISVNLVIGFYIYMAMKETPHQEPQPDPTFLANAKASINQPTSSQVSDDSHGKGKVE